MRVPFRPLALTVGLFAAAAFGPDAHAQGAFRGFLQAGGNATQIDGDDLAGYNRLGAMAGVGVFRDLQDRWRGSLAIAYSQQGSAATNRELGRSIYDRIALNYVAVPLMVHYMDWLSADEYYYRLEFCAGLEYRRLVAARATGQGGEDLTDFIDYRDNVVAFAGGVYYNLSQSLAAGLFYGRSLTDVQNDPDEVNQWSKQFTLQLRYIL